MGHICAQERRLALLELHDVQHEHTQHAHIVRVLLVQDLDELDQLLLVLVHLALVPPGQQVRDHLLDGLGLGVHEGIEDPLEDFFLRVGGPRLRRAEQQRGRRAGVGQDERRGELGSELKGDDAVELGRAEQVEQKRWEGQEVEEGFERGQGDGHLGLVVRVWG